MTEIQILPACINDAREILNIQKLAFKSEAEIHQDFTISPLNQTLISIQDDFSSYQFYKALVSRRIVAAVKVKLQDDTLSIGRLVVRPEYQSRGIGKQMMHFIENLYKEVKEFELFTAEKSERNTSFYKGLGYSISERYIEPGHENIILVKFIKANKAAAE